MTPSGYINWLNWEESTIWGVRRTCSVEFLKAVAMGEGLFGAKFVGGVLVVLGLAAEGGVEGVEGVIELLFFLLTTAG